MKEPMPYTGMLSLRKLHNAYKKHNSAGYAATLRWGGDTYKIKSCTCGWCWTAYDVGHPDDGSINSDTRSQFIAYIYLKLPACMQAHFAAYAKARAPKKWRKARNMRMKYLSIWSKKFMNGETLSLYDDDEDI